MELKVKLTGQEVADAIILHLKENKGIEVPSNYKSWRIEISRSFDPDHILYVTYMMKA